MIYHLLIMAALNFSAAISFIPAGKGALGTLFLEELGFISNSSSLYNSLFL
jgi:hypothetical protein